MQIKANSELTPRERGAIKTVNRLLAESKAAVRIGTERNDSSSSEIKALPHMTEDELYRASVRAARSHNGDFWLAFHI